MPAARAVIFDLDDTLYPERQYAFSGFAAVAAAFREWLGDPGEAVNAMRRLFDTDHRPRVFDFLLAERGITETEELVRQMIQTYRAHVPILNLHPDADAVLGRLHGQYKLGLITDGPPVSQWDKIYALGLGARFDAIIVTSELGPDCAKPHPRAFELIARRLGVEAPRCVYVGDNASKDFIAPNGLGWTTVRVTRRDGIYSNSVAPNGGVPNFTIDTLDDLDAIVSQV